MYTIENQKKVMRLNKVQTELKTHVEKMEVIIDNNLLDCNPELSQRRGDLLDMLYKFGRCVNDINYEDLKPDDMPLIERLNYVIHINGTKIDGSNDKAGYDIVEREEKISDIMGWLPESRGNDTELMRADLKLLVGYDDEWILSDLSTNSYIMPSVDKEAFIRECEVLVTIYKAQQDNK